MLNNFIFSGLIADYSGLKEAEGKNGSYQFVTFDVCVDDATQQSVSLSLFGEMAVQLNTCNISPQTKVNAHLRIFSRSYKDRADVWRKRNEITCWKLDVLDADGNVAFSCHKYRS